MATPINGDGPHPVGEREHLAEAVGVCARGLEAEDVAYACEVLDRYASNFLRHGQAQEVSPRQGRVIKDLGCIASLADELAGRLEDLDDMGRGTLRKVLGPVIWVERRPGGMREEREGDRLVPKHYPDGSLVAVFERADLAGPGDQLQAWDSTPLWRRLRILARAARVARHRLPPDRGGRTNSLTERLGTAKGQLCRRLGEMLLDCAERMGEPRRLSGGPAGPLYRATASIYAYATGEDPEDAALERPVKTAARLFTKREKLLARWCAISSDAATEEIDGIANQLDVIAEQLAAL